MKLVNSTIKDITFKVYNNINLFIERNFKKISFYFNIYLYLFDFFIKNIFVFILGFIFSTIFYINISIKFLFKNFIDSLKIFDFAQFFNPNNLNFLNSFNFFDYLLIVSFFSILIIKIILSIKIKSKFSVKLLFFNRIFSIITFLSFFIFGFFIHSFFYKTSLLKQKNELFFEYKINNKVKKESLLKSKKNKSLYFRGYINNNPIFIDNKVVFEFTPVDIKKIDEFDNHKDDNFFSKVFFENKNIKKFIKNEKYKNLKFLVVAEKIDFDILPEYKNFYEMKAFVRKLDESERFFINNLGFEQDIFWTLDNVKDSKKYENIYNSWISFFITKIRDRSINFFNKKSQQRFKSEFGFTKWVMFGEKKDLPEILQINKFFYNPIFLIIESKFYIWFLCFIPLIFYKKIGLFTKFLFFLISGIFLFMFGCFHFFSPIILNAICMVLFFLFFSNIFNLSKERAFFLAFSIETVFSIFILKNYFIFSDRWWIYFCSISFVFIFFTEIFDNFLCKKVKGWKFWGYFCLFLLFCFFYLINWQTINLKLNIFNIKFIFFIFIFLWILFINFLDKYYPIINLRFKNINPIIRYLFISWILICICVLLPLSIIYGEYFCISLIVLLFPLFFLFFFIFQISFIIFFVNIYFLEHIFISLYFKYFKMCIIIFNKIFIKYLNNVIYKFSTIDFNFSMNLYWFIFIYLFFIFIFFLFINKKNKFKLHKYFLLIKNFLFKLINFKNLLIFFLIILITAYCLALFLRNREALNIKFFQNNYGNYVYFQTPAKQKIFLWNVKKLDFTPINLRFINFHSDINFFRLNGIQKINKLIFNNFLDNPDIFFLYKEFFENQYLDNASFDKFKKFSLSKKNKNVPEIFFDISKEDINNIKSLNISYFDLKSNIINNAKLYEQFIKLNLFIDILDKSNLKINLYNKNIKKLFILEDSLNKKIFVLNLLYNNSKLNLFFKYDLDSINILIDKKMISFTDKEYLSEYAFQKKTAYFQKSKFLDGFRILFNSLKFNLNIKDNFLINYMNVKCFGNKTIIKFLE